MQIGFQRTNDNSSVYIKEGQDKKIMLAKIFVDDTLFIGNDDLCKAFLEQMNKERKVCRNKARSVCKGYS